MKRIVIAISLLLWLINPASAQGFDFKSLPKHYICYKCIDTILIDGRIDELSWSKADWTDCFLDIEGTIKPEPNYKTKAKLLWDSKYLYIAAKLEEPNVWATILKKDSIIFNDNDFEIFIDPDGDTHNYYELEINAFNTTWDLFLTKPYRDFGIYTSGWDIKGLKTAVYVDGTLNNSSDIDGYWSLEIAIPFKSIFDNPYQLYHPKQGEQWRINFSRVQWNIEKGENGYSKTKDKSNKILPEMNWVWSPIGIVNMHFPERWGFLQFSSSEIGKAKDEFKPDPEDKVKSLLFRIYYKQNDFYTKYNHYSNRIEELFSKSEMIDFKNVKIETTQSLFEAAIKEDQDNSIWHIRQDGLIWKTNN